MRMSRKMDHVEFALKLPAGGTSGFEDIKLVHNCLPGVNVEHISLLTVLGEIELASPFFINAMTGGSSETEEINRELAIAAAETGIAMAVGSQMSAMKDPEVAGSYRTVRIHNPKGRIFANLGSEASVEQAKRAVDMLEADMLQIHLNVMQELIMPEGDREFTGMLKRIEAVVRSVDVPVMVKEVGFGILREGAAKLREVGVQIVDCGGAGGTNFAAIENARRPEPMEWLNDWGHSTAIALLETLHIYPREGQVSATGGIAGALDICKALTLGASAVGMAGTLLKVQRSQGTDALIREIRRLQSELKLLCTALGVRGVRELRHVPAVISGSTLAWCEQRNIDTFAVANRTGVSYD